MKPTNFGAMFFKVSDIEGISLEWGDIKRVAIWKKLQNERGYHGERFLVSVQEAIVSSFNNFHHALGIATAEEEIFGFKEFVNYRYSKLGFRCKYRYGPASRRSLVVKDTHNRTRKARRDSLVAEYEMSGGPVGGTGILISLAGTQPIKTPADFSVWSRNVKYLLSSFDFEITGKESGISENKKMDSFEQNGENPDS
jgi:hypothetical protein